VKNEVFGFFSLVFFPSPPSPCLFFSHGCGRDHHGHLAGAARADTRLVGSPTPPPRKPAMAAPGPALAPPWPYRELHTAMAALPLQLLHAARRPAIAAPLSYGRCLSDRLSLPSAPPAGDPSLVPLLSLSRPRAASPSATQDCLPWPHRERRKKMCFLFWSLIRFQ
jgi:hypothetical protein